MEVPTIVTDDYDVTRTESEVRLAKLQKLLRTDSSGNVQGSVGMSSRGRYKTLDTSAPQVQMVNYMDVNYISDPTGQIGSLTNIHGTSAMQHLSTIMSNRNVRSSHLKVKESSLSNRTDREGPASAHRTEVKSESKLSSEESLPFVPSSRLNTGSSGQPLAAESKYSYIINPYSNLGLPGEPGPEETPSNVQNLATRPSSEEVYTSGRRRSSIGWQSQASSRRSSGVPPIPMSTRRKSSSGRHSSTPPSSTPESASKTSTDIKKKTDQSRNAPVFSSVSDFQEKSRTGDMCTGQDSKLDRLLSALHWLDLKSEKERRKTQTEEKDGRTSELRANSQLETVVEEDEEDDRSRNKDEHELDRLEAKMNEEQMRESILKTIRHQLEYQIPLPIKVAIIDTAIPIVENTLKEYRKVLGNKHVMTMQANERLNQLKAEKARYG